MLTGWRARRWPPGHLPTWSRGSDHLVARLLELLDRGDDGGLGTGRAPPGDGGGVALRLPREISSAGSAREFIRVEVADTGAGALQLKEPSAEAVSGRGLLLVEALSRTWGTSADSDQKVVWFEL